MKCRDLSETKSIKIDDAEFVVGIVSRKNWRDIANRFNQATTVIRKYREPGKEQKTEEILQLAQKDPEYAKYDNLLQEVYRDCCRLGVKGHSGITDSKDQPIKFEMNDQLMEIYELNKLDIRLGMEVYAFNTMTEGDQKN